MQPQYPNVPMQPQYPQGMQVPGMAPAPVMAPIPIPVPQYPGMVQPGMGMPVGMMPGAMGMPMAGPVAPPLPIKPTWADMTVSKTPLREFQARCFQWTPEDVTYNNVVSRFYHFLFMEPKIIVSDVPFNQPIIDLRIKYSLSESSGWGFLGDSLAACAGIMRNELDIDSAINRIWHFRRREHNYGQGMSPGIVWEAIQVEGWPGMYTPPAAKVDAATAATQAVAQLQAAAALAQQMPYQVAVQGIPQASIVTPGIPSAPVAVPAVETSGVVVPPPAMVTPLAAPIPAAAVAIGAKQTVNTGDPNMDYLINNFVLGATPVAIWQAALADENVKNTPALNQLLMNGVSGTPFVDYIQAQGLVVKDANGVFAVKTA